jgi:hypothetical protein
LKNAYIRGFARPGKRKLRPIPNIFFLNINAMVFNLFYEKIHHPDPCSIEDIYHEAPCSFQLRGARPFLGGCGE